jgi:anti-sigma factor RsiW
MVNESNKQCLTQDIAAYIDGELSPALEIELEMHIASCEPCLFEVNEQKRFLRELESSLHYENDLELPANFTKVVVANAESSVSGLRRPSERYYALIVSLTLSLFVLIAVGPEAGKAIAGVAHLADQVGAVAGFFGHSVYSLFLGVVIILRAIASQGSVDSMSLLALFSLVILTLTAVSRKAVRIRRV